MGGHLPTATVRTGLLHGGPKRQQRCNNALFLLQTPTADAYLVTEACWVLRGEDGEAEEWVKSYP